MISKTEGQFVHIKQQSTANRNVLYFYQLLPFQFKTLKLQNEVE